MRTFGQQLFEAYTASLRDRSDALLTAAGRDPRLAQLGNSRWEDLNDAQRELWEATAEQFAIVLAMQQTEIVRRIVGRIRAHHDAIEAAGPIRTPDTEAAQLKHAADAELWSVLELGA